MKRIIPFLFFLLSFYLFFPDKSIAGHTGPGAEWIGKNKALFGVDPEGRLRLDIEPAGSGSLSIGREIRYAPDMQWEFDVHMRYLPSDQNKLCVFLYQENADRFYYVRIGYQGDRKLGLRRHGEVDLFARKAIDFGELPVLLHVKVTLEKNEKWTFYSRLDNRPGYRLEGSCIYPIKEPPASGTMIFTFYYTKTRSDLFGIGPVTVSDYVSPTPLEGENTHETDEKEGEEVLPHLVNIEPVSLDMLRFLFDKPVDIGEAVFSISDIGDAYRAHYVDEQTKTEIGALFSQEMQPGGDYTISYKGLCSERGTPMPPYSTTVRLQETENEADSPGNAPTGSFEEGEIVINEIMADPKGLTALPETEYVEVYNASNREISLAGWRFVYGGVAKNIGEAVLSPDTYALLFREGREIGTETPGLKVPMKTFPAALANAGKTIALLDPSGKEIDKVVYEQAVSGKSWERFGSAWQLSSDPRGGTPGAPNSSSQDEPALPDEKEEDPDAPPVESPLPAVLVRPGEIVFNELLPNPYFDGSEYVELYNRSDRPLPLTGLAVAVRKKDGSLGTAYPLKTIRKMLDPGKYALISKKLDGVRPFYRIADPDALYEVPKFPVLANTSSTLVLFRLHDETIIDEVAYSYKWHSAFLKQTKGISIERIDPEGETQDPANWTSASEIEQGTPGYQNSQYGASSAEQVTGIDAPVWIEGDDLYVINWLLDQPGYTCRAFVYNLAGQRVAEILNRELVGVSGKLEWDGASLNGKRLHAGVYLFYAEVYHPNGTVKTFKKAFLVR